MKKQNQNIILFGANYFGRMAGSQRVYNLFSPLLDANLITLHNIVNYQDKGLINDDKVDVVCPRQVNKILNTMGYISLSNRKLAEWYDANSHNILYHYGYPSLESFPILKKAKTLGYKIVIDIVENIYAFSNRNASFIHRLKNFTSLLLATRMEKCGDICFGISDTLVDLCERLTKNKIPVKLLPISVDVDIVCSYKKNDKKIDEVAVYYGGSFGQKDGISYLIEGFTKAWEQNKRLKLYLTGKIAKESAGELEQLIEKSEAKEAINYLGCLSTEEYYERMANSDILCMLRVNSAFANSGFPFKLGEYLASGNAVIATCTSDIEKYLTHKQNAYLIQPEDSTLIADAILALAEDEELRKTIGTVGQLVAKENFDAPKVSNYLYNTIKQL